MKKYCRESAGRRYSRDAVAGRGQNGIDRRLDGYSACEFLSAAFAVSCSEMGIHMSKDNNRQTLKRWEREEDNRTETFLELYREPVPEYIRILEQKAMEEEVPIIRHGTRDVLRFLLKTQRPQKVLEVGTAVGYSALYMRHCLPPESRITTIEKVPMRIRQAKKNFAAYDPDGRIRLMEGDAGEKLHSLAEEGETYDFIFMDAAKAQYKTYLPDVLQLMNPGAFLVSDNILHEGDVLESRYGVTRRDRTIHARMREYLSLLMETEELETICLPAGDGMTISRAVRMEG